MKLVDEGAVPASGKQPRDGDKSGTSDPGLPILTPARRPSEED